MLKEFHSKEKWNGENLPNFIKNILDKFGNNLYLGGGSLIRTKFFNNENWGFQDYDFWATKNTNNNVYNYFKNNNILISDEYLNDFYFENYNGIRYIERVHTVCIENFTIQLIDIKKPKDINKIMKNVDLTFTGCLYNGVDIFYGIDPENIKNKKGDIIIHDYKGNSYYPQCYLISSKFKKLNDRVKKYLSRGFTFMNLCPWCNQAINPQISHLKECLIYTHLGNIKPPVILLSYEEIYKKINKDKNPELIIAFLSAILENRDINKFNYYFEKLNPNSVNLDNNYLMLTATKLGLYSIVKKIYDYSEKKNIIKMNIEEPDHSLIKIAIKK